MLVSVNLDLTDLDFQMHLSVIGHCLDVCKLKRKATCLAETYQQLTACWATNVPNWSFPFFLDGSLLLKHFLELSSANTYGLHVKL